MTPARPCAWLLAVLLTRVPVAEVPAPRHVPMPLPSIFAPPVETIDDGQGWQIAVTAALFEVLGRCEGAG